MTLFSLIALLPIALILFINFLVILVRHIKATKQIPLLKRKSASDDLVITNVKMKSIWNSGMKQYISLITNCDIYLAENYFAIAPFQIFPFKAYHKPIIMTKEINNLKSTFPFIKIRCPDKIIFKELIKDEIEILYHENHNKYQIRLKGLNPEDKSKLERLRNCC